MDGCMDLSLEGQISCLLSRCVCDLRSSSIALV